MPKSLPRLSVLLLFLLLPTQLLQSEVRIDWQAPFTSAEQARLTTWLNESIQGLESLVGPIPFEIHIYVYRRDGSREPVPWANTRRGGRQGVNFHVDPNFDLAAFRGDWTAAHELSHLVLPYLGEKDAWFAEGFASYMQYQVMMATRVLTSAQASERYLERLNRARSRYPFHDQPFADAAPMLRQARAYPVMYWGGAAYFLQVDAALKQQTDTSLIAVLARYLSCCRKDRKNLDTLVATLDTLSDSTIFTTHLQRFRTEPGFPSFAVLETDKL